MSFQLLGKKNNINQEPLIEGPIDFTKISLPFSKLQEKNTTSYIYSGSETIPFTERDPTYQSIFKNEFADGDLFEIHQHLIRINYLLTKLSE